MIDNLFLCVGAQKAGTTWLYNVLKHNNDIEFSTYKEIHYFDYVAGQNKILLRRIVKDVKSAVVVRGGFCNNEMGEKITHFGRDIVNDNWYLSQFRGAAAYAADFTPEYALLDVDGLRRVKRVSNKQKVLFIMRDPVERSLSALQYFYQMRGGTLDNASQNEVCKKLNSKLILSRSRYEQTINTLDTLFLRDNVLYLFYEDMMEDKVKSIRKIEKFLGISEGEYKEENVERLVNASQKYKYDDWVYIKLIGHLEETYRFVEKRFGRTPDRWYKYC